MTPQQIQEWAEDKANEMPKIGNIGNRPDLREFTASQVKFVTQALLEAVEIGRAILAPSSGGGD